MCSIRYFSQSGGLGKSIRCDVLFCNEGGARNKRTLLCVEGGSRAAPTMLSLD